MMEQLLRRLGLLHPQDEVARERRLERVREMDKATEAVRSGRVKVSIYINDEASREEARLRRGKK